MTTITWVHTEGLSTPAIQPAIFVFAPQEIKGWSCKRIGFIYECLLELPVTIRQGDLAETVLAFASEHNAQRIVTRPFVSPLLAQAWTAISEKLPAQVLPEEPFVHLPVKPDLRRFSRYFQQASKALASAASPAPTPSLPPD